MCAHADDSTVHLIGGRVAFEQVRMRVGVTNMEAAAFESVLPALLHYRPKKGNNYSDKQLLLRFAEQHLCVCIYALATLLAARY